MSGHTNYYDYRTYAATVPPLQDGREAKHHEVMICGGGPVGLALALALAKYGIGSVIIDADTTVCQGSRATCLSRRTFDILDRLGVLEPFMETSLGWTSGRSFYKGAEVLRFDMAHSAEERFLPMFNIQQYYVEQFLVDEIEKYPHLIEIRWGTEVKRVQTGSGGTDVELQSAGQTYSAHATWLVACDGGRSRVRQDLGLRMNGTAYEARYVIVDIKIDLPWPTGRLAWFNPSSNPGRTMLMHRQPDKIWRVDYQLNDGEDAEEMITPEKVNPVVEAHMKMLNIDLPWEIVWSSTYRASALSLDRYLHDNVIFAGDAAHLVPIFGVRGLNSGFDDAFNLGWKLAYVLKGLAPVSLLESYSQERRAAWGINVAHAMKSTEFMAPTSRGFQLMREAVLSLAGQHPELRALINPRQSSAIPYDDSVLNTISADESSFAGPLRPGLVVPECRVKDGSGDSFLTRHLTDGFNLMVFPKDDALNRDVVAQAKKLSQTLRLDLHILAVTNDTRVLNKMPEGVTGLTDIGSRCHQLFDAAPGAFYLVRPDGYICARWRSADPRCLETALNAAIGHQASTPENRIAV